MHSKKGLVLFAPLVGELCGTSNRPNVNIEASLNKRNTFRPRVSTDKRLLYRLKNEDITTIICLHRGGLSLRA